VLAWIGWIGLNTAGALLFAGSEPGGVVLVAVNTTVCAGAAALAAVLMTRLRFGKPDASLAANGWVGGLVASSAVSAFATPALTIVIGLIAGGVITLSVEWLDRIEIDDPAGAVSVHALGGIWGVLAVGLFAQGRMGPGQMLAQVIGVATLLGAVLPLTYSLNWLLNLLLPQRVSADGERQGLDLHELGAGAYPEFTTLGDEFTQH
jgi:Amt family ammonium transporter